MNLDPEIYFWNVNKRNNPVCTHIDVTARALWNCSNILLLLHRKVNPTNVLEWGHDYIDLHIDPFYGIVYVVE